MGNKGQEDRKIQETKRNHKLFNIEAFDQNKMKQLLFVSKFISKSYQIVWFQNSGNIIPKTHPKN
jgi:hypothetical protein